MLMSFDISNRIPQLNRNKRFILFTLFVILTVFICFVSESKTTERSDVQENETFEDFVTRLYPPFRGQSYKNNVANSSYFLLGFKNNVTLLNKYKSICKWNLTDGNLYLKEPFRLLFGNVKPFKERDLCETNQHCPTLVCIIDRGEFIKKNVLETLKSFELTSDDNQWFLVQVTISSFLPFYMRKYPRAEYRNDLYRRKRSSKTQSIPFNDIPIGYMNQGSLDNSYMNAGGSYLREAHKNVENIHQKPFENYVKNMTIRQGEVGKMQIGKAGLYTELTLFYIDQVSQSDKTIPIHPAKELIPNEDPLNWIKFYKDLSLITFSPDSSTPGVGPYSFKICGYATEIKSIQSCAHFTVKVEEPYALKESTTIDTEAGMLHVINDPIGTKFPSIKTNLIKSIEHRTTGNVLAFFNLSRLIFVTELNHFSESSLITFNVITDSDAFRLEILVKTKRLDRTNTLLVNYRTIMTLKDSDDTCNLELLHRFYIGLLKLISLSTPRTLDVSNIRLIQLFSSCNTIGRNDFVNDLPVFLKAKTTMTFDWLIIVNMNKADEKETTRVCETLELNEMSNIDTMINNSGPKLINQKYDFENIRDIFAPQELKRTERRDIHGGECPLRSQFESSLYSVPNNTNILLGIPFKIKIERTRLSQKLILCNEDFTHNNVPRWLAFNSSEDTVIGLVTEEDRVETNQRYSFNLCTVLAEQGALRLSSPNQNPTFHLHLNDRFEKINSHKISSSLRPINSFLNNFSGENEHFRIILAIEKFVNYHASYLSSNCQIPECDHTFGNAYDGQNVFVSSWEFKQNQELQIVWHWIPLSRLIKNGDLNQYSSVKRCNIANSIIYLKKVVDNFNDFIKSGSNKFGDDNFLVINHNLLIGNSLSRVESLDKECINLISNNRADGKVVSDFTVYAGYAFTQPIFPQISMDDALNIKVVNNDNQDVDWIRYRMSNEARGHELIGLPFPAIVKDEPYSLQLNIMFANKPPRIEAFRVTVSMPKFYPKHLLPLDRHESYFPKRFLDELNHLIKLELNREPYSNENFDTLKIFQLMQLINEYLNKCSPFSNCKMDIVLLEVIQLEKNAFVVTAAMESLFSPGMLTRNTRDLYSSTSVLSYRSCPIERFEQLETMLASRDIVTKVQQRLNLRLTSSKISLQNVCKEKNPGPMNKFDTEASLSTKTYPKYLFLLTVIVPICAFVILTLLFTLILIYCVQKKKKNRFIDQGQNCVSNGGGILSNIDSNINEDHIKFPKPGSTSTLCNELSGNFCSYDYNTGMNVYPNYMQNFGTIKSTCNGNGMIMPTSPKPTYNMNQYGYNAGLDNMSMTKSYPYCQEPSQQTPSIMMNEDERGYCTQPSDPLIDTSHLMQYNQMMTHHQQQQLNPTNYYPNLGPIKDSARNTPLLNHRKYPATTEDILYNTCHNGANMYPGGNMYNSNGDMYCGSLMRNQNTASTTPIDQRYHQHNMTHNSSTMVKRNGLGTLKEFPSKSSFDQHNGIDTFTLPSATNQLWNNSNRNSIFLGDKQKPNDTAS